MEEEIPRVEKFEIDHNYIYMLSGNDRRSSPQKNNNFSSNNSPEYNREMSKIRVEAYDKDKIMKGKGYS